MRVRGILYWMVFGYLLALRLDLAAEEPNAKTLAKRAKQLWAQYQAECRNIRDGQSVTEKTRRLALVAQLGELRSPRAAEYALRVIKADPDIGVRLEAMTSVARIGDLKALDKALRYVGRQSRTVLPEMAWEALAKSTDIAVGDWLATEMLAKASARLRLSLVQALGVLKPPRARVPLVRMYEQYCDTPKEVVLVYEVVRALGKIGGPEAEPVLLAAASHRDWRVRAAAADVLVPKPDSTPEMIAVLRRLLADPNALVAQRAARNVGLGRARALVPSLLAHLEAHLLKTRKTASDALKAISGRDLGLDVSAWKRWWATVARDGDEMSTKGQPEPMTVATYHGIKMFSNRIVFVVDVSGSMRFPEPGPSRIEVARKELVHAIGALGPSTSFNILVFSNGVRSWQRREALATEQKKRAAVRWIDKRLRPQGMTNTCLALATALDAHAGVDTVFLLSDGFPSVGVHTDGAVIVNQFAAANRFRGAAVNTISLLLNDEFSEANRLSPESAKRVESFLRDLADRTGGTFRAVNKYPPDWRR